MLADEIAALLRQGTEYSGLTVQLGEDGEVDPESLGRCATTESQVVLHHAAEAVIRLNLAHLGRPDCPWLELSRATNFREFKQRVRDEIVDVRRSGQLERSVAWVFLGRAEPKTEEDDEKWADACTNLASFLRVLAGGWLDDTRLYNALEHGLAVLPGDAVFQLIGKDGDAVRMGEGTSIELLEPTEWDEGRRRWQLTTNWLDVRESLGLIEVVCMMIDSLWLVARHRYVGGPGEGELFYPLRFTPADLRGQVGAMGTFSLKLLEEHRPPRRSGARSDEGQAAAGDSNSTSTTEPRPRRGGWPSKVLGTRYEAIDRARHPSAASAPSMIQEEEHMPQTPDPKTVASKCLAPWSTDDLATTRSLLDDEVTFRGPLGATDGADAYIEGIQGMIQIVEKLDQRQVFGEGENVCIIYDLITKKPPASIPTAGWYTVRDGKVTSVRAFFDARPLTSPR